MCNCSDYSIYDNIADITELGREIAFQLYGFDEDSPIGTCVDYTEFGKNFRDAHPGIFHDGKYIIAPSVTNMIYDGVMFPGTDKFDLQTRFAVKVVSGEKFGMKDDSCEIWLKFPASEYALDRAAHRPGEENIDSCLADNAKYPEVLEYFIRDCRSDIRELNILAEVLSSYTDPAQTGKLEAVLEYEGEKSRDITEVINIACNLECYNYDPEIETADDYLVKFYDNDLIKLAKSKEYEANQLMLEHGGRITESGYVERNDLPMKQVYDPPEPEQQQGMTM